MPNYHPTYIATALRIAATQPDDSQALSALRHLAPCAAVILESLLTDALRYRFLRTDHPNGNAVIAGEPICSNELQEALTGADLDAAIDKAMRP
jgi:hypothetical protein